MQIKNLFPSLFLCLYLLLTGCSKDQNEMTENPPLRFANTSYEVRIGQQEAIGFVEGSGDYFLKIENPELLEATLRPDLKQLFINSKQKGETTLAITDNKARETIQLKIKVTDSYLGFTYKDSNIPGFTPGTDLFFVNNPEKDFYVFKQEKGTYLPEGTPILQGHYETFSEEGCPYLILHYQYKDQDAETHRYDLSESSPEIYTIMNKYLDSNWIKQTPANRSIAPKYYYLHINEVAGSYWGTWAVDLMCIPPGILK